MSAASPFRVPLGDRSQVQHLGLVEDAARGEDRDQVCEDCRKGAYGVAAGFHDADPQCHWTPQRFARLGFLMGKGMSAKRIAEHPAISSTPNTVRYQAHKFGLAFCAVLTAPLPKRATSYFETAAAKRGITRDELIKLLLLEIAADSNLLDNILDDGA